MRSAHCLIVTLAGLLLTMACATATAATADRCLAVSDAGPRIHRASLRPVVLKPTEVRLTFVGHATFLIESAGGVKIATDYNDYLRPRVVPDIITMNHAHETHFTPFPDPRIRHVLRGWNPAGGPAMHDLTVGDVRVRNVTTNLRGWTGGTEMYGNSIFVFEIAGLCIAHLGHLHHTLTPRHLGQIGQLDVVLAPVDGSYTLDMDGMLEVLKALRARLVIPMHYFGETTLTRFLQRMQPTFKVKRSSTPTVVISHQSLPAQPEILVLPGN